MNAMEYDGMNDLELIKQFADFLCEKSLYTQFIEYLNDQGYDGELISTQVEYIQNAE